MLRELIIVVYYPFSFFLLPVCKPVLPKFYKLKYRMGCKGTIKKREDLTPYFLF
jgi:hypothetical protein